jgi:1,4-alpha-glucan branching enzyme
VLVVAAVVVTSAVIGSGAQSDSVVVHLSLEAPEAEAVSVVGDWNDWDPKAHVMKDENGDGVWEVRIEVSKDREYEYQFLLNGDKWIPDPNAPLHVSDGFGGKNSVLNI